MSQKKPASQYQNAHVRLKGCTFQDMNSVTDNENSTHEKTPITPPHVPSRGRPPKHAFAKKEIPSRKPTDDPVYQTFIIKLFDRSVDLSKYEENTSLYPICRSWMINQPRSNRLTNFSKKKSPTIETRNELEDIVKDLKSGKVSEILSMPAMTEAKEVTRVPSPKSVLDKDKIYLNYNLDNPPMSRVDLLADLKLRSSAARYKWQKQSIIYQEAKFSNSLRVLEHIYKK